MLVRPLDVRGVAEIKTITRHELSPQTPVSEGPAGVALCYQHDSRQCQCERVAPPPTPTTMLLLPGSFVPRTRSYRESRDVRRAPGYYRWIELCLQSADFGVTLRSILRTMLSLASSQPCPPSGGLSQGEVDAHCILLVGNMYHILRKLLLGQGRISRASAEEQEMLRVRNIAQVGRRRDRFKLLGDSIVPTLEPKPFASIQRGEIPRLVAVKYESPTSHPEESVTERILVSLAPRPSFPSAVAPKPGPLLAEEVAPHF